MPVSDLSQYSMYIVGCNILCCRAHVLICRAVRRTDDSHSMAVGMHATHVHSLLGVGDDACMSCYHRRWCVIGWSAAVDGGDGVSSGASWDSSSVFFSPFARIERTRCCRLLSAMEYVNGRCARSLGACCHVKRAPSHRRSAARPLAAEGAQADSVAHTHRAVHT